MIYTGLDILKPCMVQYFLELHANNPDMLRDDKVQSISAMPNSPGTIRVNLHKGEYSDKYTVGKWLSKHIFAKYRSEMIMHGTTAYSHLMTGEGWPSTHETNIYCTLEQDAPLIIVGENDQVSNYLNEVKFTKAEKAVVSCIAKYAWHIMEGLKVERHLKEKNLRVYIRSVVDEGFVFYTENSREQVTIALDQFRRSIKQAKVTFVDSRCSGLLCVMENNRISRNDNVLAYFQNECKLKHLACYVYVEYGTCTVYSRKEADLTAGCKLIQSLVCVDTCLVADKRAAESQLEKYIKHKQLIFLKETSNNITYVCTKNVHASIQEALKITYDIQVPEVWKQYLQKYKSSCFEMLQSKYLVEAWLEQECIFMKGLVSNIKTFRDELKRTYVQEKYALFATPPAIYAVEKQISSIADHAGCCVMRREHEELYGSCRLISTWQHNKYGQKVFLLEGAVSCLPNVDSVLQVEDDCQHIKVCK